MKIKKTIAAALTVVMLSTAASGVFASGANENISGGINGGAEETQSYLGDNESELLVSPSPGIFDDNEEGAEDVQPTLYPSGIQTAEPDINIESSSPEPYPETTDVPSEEPANDVMISSYQVNFSCQLDGWPRKDYAVFNICSEDGKILDSHTKYITDTESFSIDFNIPDSKVGTVFYLEVTGVDSIDYYSDNYPVPLTEKIPLYTYWSEPDENGDRVPVSSAHMTAHVRTQCPINIYADGEYVSLSSPAIFDGSYIIAPLSEIAGAIGISDCTYFPEYNSVKVKTGDNEMLVNIGYSYLTAFGSDINLDLPVSNINSLTYIELRPFIEAFGSTLEYYDNGSYIDIKLTKSPMAVSSIADQEARINESGVGSSTDYLIWVNKEKFRCTVFSGSKGNWKWVKDFTVGIGAEGRETITGVFEYIDYTNMWPYDSYYVGPVMVFYGNYALHSTFLKYDGTPYDNTVGAKISHGCVRCQAKYINWIVDNIPMKTRVYVTES